jgi:hypothetical protein
MSTKITTENWNTALYHSDNLIAFVSLGAAPVENESEIEVRYYVTLSNKDYEDIYQSGHKSIEEAVLVLNQKYGDWPIKSLMQAESDSGCSTCTAH